MKNLIIFILDFYAGVVKLVDTLDLGSSASRLGGSSPFTRTQKNTAIDFITVFFYVSNYFPIKI